MNTDVALVAPEVDQVTRLVMSRKSKILSVLPKGIDGDLVLRKAITEFRRNRELMRCTPASLFHAVCDAVSNGLEIGGVKGHCYIVPYGSEAVLQIGYKGFLELLRRTDQLKDCSFQMVHDGDHFVHEKGDEERIEHRNGDDPDRENKPVTHVYAVFRLKNGGIVRNVWPAAQIQAHKEQYSVAYQRSESYRKRQEKNRQAVDEKKLSPWHTNWRSMAIKTVVRDTFARGLLPMSDSVQQVIERENQMEHGRVVTTNEALEAALSDSVADDLASTKQQLEAPAESKVDPEQVASGIVMRLADAANLAAVTAVREQFGDLSFVDDAWLDAVCTEREESIRSSKSDRAEAT
jgi:recombination protein RecT